MNFPMVVLNFEKGSSGPELRTCEVDSNQRTGERRQAPACAGERQHVCQLALPSLSLPPSAASCGPLFISSVK